jgi:hypothetical protein
VAAVTQAERARAPYACRSHKSPVSRTLSDDQNIPLTFQSGAVAELVRTWKMSMSAGQCDRDRCDAASFTVPLLACMFQGNLCMI